MKNYILIALIILIVATAVMITMTLPRYQEYAGLSYQLSQKRANIRTEEVRLGEMAAIQQRLNQRSANLSKIASSLPLHPDAPAVIIFLLEKAAENGLVIDGSPNTSTVYHPWGGSAVGINSVKVSLSVAGPYSSLRGFVQSVESSARLIRVTHVSSGGEGKEGRRLGALTHQLNFEAFFYQN